MSDQLALFDQTTLQVARAVDGAPDDLPRLARDIMEVIGECATIKLIGEFGGTTLRIPHWPLPAFGPQTRRTAERIECVIGAESSAKLMERYSGDVLCIPKCEDAMRTLRNRSIVRDYSNGKRPADLARRWDLTERSIWNILKTTT